MVVWDLYQTTARSDFPDCRFHFFSQWSLGGGGGGPGGGYPTPPTVYSHCNTSMPPPPPQVAGQTHFSRQNAGEMPGITAARGHNTR